MHRWGSKREMMGDDPPYLAVGTDVSAKYKGAFCEAKVRKVVRIVKCKVTYGLGLGTAVVTDDQIRGTLRAGSIVEAKHADRKEFVEGTITKIQDCSQYTVVFDDGDITTLRRTALCLKSGRHFAESETLDQLPLTHPEHFGNPVIGGRTRRRFRQDQDSTDDEEQVRGASKSAKGGSGRREEKEADIGKVVCVEGGEKKKQKDNWFPGLVVAPTAQDAVRIHVRDEYLVRSFKDGRYFTVPKKEATEFTREIGSKVESSTLRAAVEKAVQFLDRDELPPHWDRDLLFGTDEHSDHSDSDPAFDSDSSDDEPREEKDHFVAQLYKFMDDRGTPINRGPTIASKDVDLYKLFKVVHKLGGYNRVTNHNQWKTIAHKLGFGQNAVTVNLVKHAYKKFLHSFEDFYRKLGCTMVNHPRGNRSRHRSNRSLIRDKDRATPTITARCDKEKFADKENEDTLEATTNTKREEIVKQKVDEVTPETPKATREHRKELQRTLPSSKLPIAKIKDVKIEKKEDKQSGLALKKLEIDMKIKEEKIKDEKSREEKIKEEKSKEENSREEKNIEENIKEEKLKSDNREVRIKMRDIVRMDSAVPSLKDSKVEKRAEKEIINKPMPTGGEKDILKALKSFRRDSKECKKVEKEEDKGVTKIRVGKKHSSEVAQETKCKDSGVVNDKKHRSLLSRVTGRKRNKLIVHDKIPRTKPAIGITAMRQKRSLKERCKAIFKKLKIRNSSMKEAVVQKVPPPEQDPSDKEEKKKISDEDSDKSVQSKESSSPSSNGAVGKPRKEISSPVFTPEAEKKRVGRKPKKKSDSNEDELDRLPSYKSVSVGDKLKVYYGPTHESKVTYEAKVLNEKREGGEGVYFVHYTGWNTRYDEWIKRNRIADNLSWTPNRARRNKQSGSTWRGGSSKRGRNSESGGGGGGGRSTTPSSITSSSSRAKSPSGMRFHTRRGSTRHSTELRTRSRLTSLNTDGSDSDSMREYESDTDVENALILTRRRSKRRSGRDVVDEQERRRKDDAGEEGEGEDEREDEDEEEEDEDCGLDVNAVVKQEPLEVEQIDCVEKTLSEGNKVEGKRNSPKEGIETVCDKVEQDDSELKGNRSVDESEEQCLERRRSRRVTHRKEDMPTVVKIVGEEKERDKGEAVEDQPKGRDFDLNQIRSELKGIEKAVKIAVDAAQPVKSTEVIEIEDDIESSAVKSDVDNIKKEENISEQATEDVYEFKEPEPFKFEARTKCGEEKGTKLQRRSIVSLFDDVLSDDVITNDVRTPTIRRKIAIMKPSSENKKRSRQSPVKKDDVHRDLPTASSPIAVKKPLQACEEAFDKLCGSPLVREVPMDEGTKAKQRSQIDELEPLRLFSDLPAEVDELDEDSGDRLVISEGDDTEIDTLFTYQQRDHEELFPTLSSESCSQASTQQTENLESTPFISVFTSFPVTEVSEKINSPEEEILELKIVCDSSGQETPKDDDTEEQDEEKQDKEELDEEYQQDEEERDEGDQDEERQANELQDEGELEEDPINTAIQRVISHSMSDEGSNDIDLLATPVKESEECASDRVVEEIIEEDKPSVEEEEQLVTGDLSDVEVIDNLVLVRTSSNTLGLVRIESKEDLSEPVEDSPVVSEKEGKGSDNPVVVEEGLHSVITVQDDNKKDAVIKEEIPPVLTDESSEDKCVAKEEQSEVIGEDEEVEEVEEEATERENNLQTLLLCEETIIPGSPAEVTEPAGCSKEGEEEGRPMGSGQLPFASAPGNKPLAAPVTDNTPPTTPESSLSPISNSPRGERSGSPPVLDNESTKSQRDSSEIEMDTFPEPTKVGHYSEEDTVCNMRENREMKRLITEADCSVNKKHKRSRKRSVCVDNSKRSKRRHCSPRNNDGSGSDTDSDSDNTPENSMPRVQHNIDLHSPKPSKYNYLLQIDPELDSSQRIALLQQRIQELRKTYMAAKTELACIDRRRKKLRRREREEKMSKQEVPCS